MYVYQEAPNSEYGNLYYHINDDKDVQDIPDDGNLHLDKGKLCESTCTQSGV